MQLDFGESQAVTHCLRCGDPCRVKPGARNEDARILRAAKEPKGVCASCAVTAFLQSPEFPFRGMIEDNGPARVLSLPHVQQQMGAILRAAHSDAGAEEISWERVIGNWDLPHPPGTFGKGRRR